MSDTQQQIEDHLRAVHEDPGTPLNERLLDGAALTLAPTLIAEDRQLLVLQSYQLLSGLEQDPRPLIRLLEKLLEPVALSTISQLEPPVDFIAGLNPTAEDYNAITLSILAKASPSEASGLAASQPKLLAALVQLWLCAPDEGIADRAGGVLLGWLRADWQRTSVDGVEGAVWRRIWRDRDVYSLFYRICSAGNGPSGFELSKSRRTIAQARLLALLPDIGSMSWRTISQSCFPDVEQSYGLSPGQGLLDFATSYMVATSSDVLMHRTLITFYSDLLQKYHRIDSSHSVSAPLDYLIANGQHASTMLYFIEPTNPQVDPLDISFLYGAAAEYVATCLETYPELFANDRTLYRPILDRLRSSLDQNKSRSSWSDTMGYDLHVLASIPRSLLVSLGSHNPLLLVQTRIGDAGSLNTIASLLHGPVIAKYLEYPSRDDPSSSANQKLVDSEARAAQQLYVQIITERPQFWGDIVGHASTIALPNAALAALNIIKAVITANWTASTNERPIGNAATVSETGVNGNPVTDAILSEFGSARATLVPFLLSPSKSFGNLVGGHGDAESAAYKIAVAKRDALKALYERIKQRAEYSGLTTLIGERLMEGTMGRSGELGGRIATMEL